MVTFIQATYALATFVHIRNISSVTGPILTKHFGPNLWGHFFSEQKLDPNYGVIICMDPKPLQTQKKISGPKFSSDSKFFSYIKYFSKHFSDQKFICSQRFVDQKLFFNGPKMDTQIFNPNFFGNIFFLKFFGPHFFLTFLAQIFLDQMFWTCIFLTQSLWHTHF